MWDSGNPVNRRPKSIQSWVIYIPIFIDRHGVANVNALRLSMRRIMRGDNDLNTWQPCISNGCQGSHDEIIRLVIHVVTLFFSYVGQSSFFLFRPRNCRQARDWKVPLATRSEWASEVKYRCSMGGRRVGWLQTSTANRKREKRTSSPPGIQAFEEGAGTRLPQADYPSGLWMWLHC